MYHLVFCLFKRLAFKLPSSVTKVLQLFYITVRCFCIRAVQSKRLMNVVIRGSQSYNSAFLFSQNVDQLNSDISVICRNFFPNPISTRYCSTHRNLMDMNK